MERGPEMWQAVEDCMDERTPRKTKGQLEAEISEAMMQFQRDQMGRGPDEAKSLHTDISTRTGERIIAVTLDQDLESRL